MIGVIIQARMGSSRLPGKILKQIGNKKLLDHIFYRLKFLEYPVTTILATTMSVRDDIVAEYCALNGIHCFRGSENNVLERYYLCAKQYEFQHVIRLTADNPFIDVEEIVRLINLHLRSQADYSHSFTALPVGVGSEIFSFAALKRCYLLGKEPHHVEHVNEYILDHPDEFKIALLNVDKSKNRPDIRLTIDTPEDYKKACYIAEHGGSQLMTTEEAIRLCLQYV
ncbi:spore coat polysaccharide biosynthesis protein SpsF [Sporomusaceae bacterium BoRhaA]|uniref:cytidylyltransferase domain-containing protein n=1 Tax=Pelorhabdus rhamnosifermentans TaxID=2772457 RepID=UPI001C0618CE|nr:hypothetical protein [Pelorhabdus rhamnosifermentans]MBU2699170.1 spore coat polysaccharide biosynthesis protein SpsF [Pelorhabdus rhamnosifermentans]